MIFLNSPLGCPLFETECFTRNNPNQLLCIQITVYFSAYIDDDLNRPRATVYIILWEENIINTI